MFFLSVDDSKMQATLNGLREALIGRGQEGDARTILKDEFRLLMRDIIYFTPPPGLGQSSKKQGEEAIKKDLNKLFTPIDEEMLNVIGSKFGVDGIDQWITDTDGSKQHLVWDKIDATGSGIESFHRQFQNRRGRTRNLKAQYRGQPFWYAAYVVSKVDFMPYLQKLLDRVGRRKAYWAIAYQALGGKVQRWVARHIPTLGHGYFINRLSDEKKPFLEAINEAPGIGDDQRIVSDAKRRRIGNMTKRIKLILSGYSEDVARGINPRRRARLTPESAEA